MDDEKIAASGQLRRLAEKVHRTGKVPFPPSFLTARPGLPDPPLARLIRGGRGGEVRLKIYLTMTMMATAKPWNLRRVPTSHGWAQLLALPKDLGPRRATDGVTWLHKNRLISIEGRTSAAPRVVLLDPAGTGQPYVRPHEAGRYVGVPVELWTRGWLLELSSTALALLVVLMDVQGGHDTFRYVIRDRKNSYRLSSDTWTRGRKELEKHSLIFVEHAPQGSIYDHTRMRNAYFVDVERTKETPGSEAAPLARERALSAWRR